MRAELRDSLEFLYPDSQVAERPCQSMSVDVARGGIASLHLLLNNLSTAGSLRLHVRENDRNVKHAQWFRLIDVPVEANTGPVCFIEKDGEHNPFVVRRAPFRVYDAMEPVDSDVKIFASTMALRLHIPVPEDIEPGAQKYRLTVQSGQEEHEFSLDVHIHTPVIPRTGRDSLPYTNWFSFDLMAERHNLEPWSEAHWGMIRRYADLMVHGRQNTFWCPLRDIFDATQKPPVLNRERLRRIVQTFTDAGMHYIEGGHPAARTDGDWDATTFELRLTKERATSIEGNAALAHLARQIMEEIERNNWRDRWFQHVTDEPTEWNATDYRILAGMVRKYMPGLPILDATQDLTIAGTVDIWCPQVQEYQKHRAAFEQQRALGDKIWYYTCCFPGGPWLNRLLDMELLRPALLGWGGALFNLDGFLHWGLNHYRPQQEPFTQSVVKHGEHNSLPAGDTHIVYPGPDGPWSSLRLEAHREGFEDYELLQQLRERDTQQADEIIHRVIRGFDDYTKDVTTFRAARKALLEALNKK